MAKGICMAVECGDVVHDRIINGKWCTKHYHRLRKHGSIELPKPPVKKVLTCNVENCDNKASSLGWCRKHYTRFRRHGNPQTCLTRRREDPEGERIWLREHIGKGSWPDSCVEWPYRVNSSGYGSVSGWPDGDTVHRITCRSVHGEAPAGRPFALHKPKICHNRRCCNPNHLYWGDPADNNADARIDGMVSVGEDKPQSKLTEDQVLEIRAAKGRLAHIVKNYPVSYQTIRDIVYGRTWRYLLPEDWTPPPMPGQFSRWDESELA